MTKVAELFSKNHAVFVYAQEKYEHGSTVHICKELKECINNSNVIISAIPLSRDNVVVNTPYSKNEISLNQLNLELDNKIFIAGGIPTQFYENKNIKNIDLLQNEELAILNAIPTSEGILKTAMEETETSIHGSNVMIFGYGRIGKLLCKSFKSLGAIVYCVARKEIDLTWVRVEGCIPIRYNEVENKANNIDIVINTVPSLVIEEKTIKKLKKNCLIIDITSNSVGVDKSIAKRYKINVITDIGIVDKIAPLTVAKYIKEVIEKIQIS